MNKKAFQRAKFCASNEASFLDEKIAIFAIIRSFLLTHQSYPKLASLARVGSNYTRVTGKIREFGGKSLSLANQLPVFSPPFSSFISLSGRNDTEFNTASFNKLSYIHTHLFVSPNSNSTKLAVVHGNPLTVSTCPLRVENVRGRGRWRRAEREEKGCIYIYIYTYIFAVCQKSVRVIHRNRRSFIRWGIVTYLWKHYLWKMCTERV